MEADTKKSEAADESKLSDMVSKSDTSDGSDEPFTSKTMVRYRWLTSVIALLIIGTYLGLMVTTAVGVTNLSQITTNALTVLYTLVMSAVTWVFGTEIIERQLDKRGDG